MASRTDSTSSEEQNLPETPYEEITLPETSQGDWDSFSSYSDLVEAYDTVIEVQNTSRPVEAENVKSLDEDTLTPNREAYDSEGESLERLAQQLEGNTLIVAFGLTGKDLPNYRELHREEMHPEGNWWDQPEKLDADYLFDRRTYEGALDPNGYEENPITQTNGLDRGLYLFRNS